MGRVASHYPFLGELSHSAVSCSQREPNRWLLKTQSGVASCPCWMQHVQQQNVQLATCVKFTYTDPKASA